MLPSLIKNSPFQSLTDPDGIRPVDAGLLGVFYVHATWCGSGGPTSANHGDRLPLVVAGFPNRRTYAWNSLLRALIAWMQTVKQGRLQRPRIRCHPRRRRTVRRKQMRTG